MNDVPGWVRNQTEVQRRERDGEETKEEREAKITEKKKLRRVNTNIKRTKKKEREHKLMEKKKLGSITLI